MYGKLDLCTAVYYTPIALLWYACIHVLLIIQQSNIGAVWLSKVKILLFHISGTWLMHD